MAVHLPLERELCPWGLAPVTSAAAQMLFGDTVAIALMQARARRRRAPPGARPLGPRARRGVAWPWERWGQGAVWRARRAAAPGVTVCSARTHRARSGPHQRMRPVANGRARQLHACC